MSTYALLDQAEEDALHKSRLLNVEEKPFKRITKRLLTPNSLLFTLPKLPPTPPPDANAANEEAAAKEIETQRQLEERRQFRDDVLLDFAAFESSIVRIQLLFNSNAKERERYAAEKLKIQATAQEVRDNTADLRVQLEEAQKTLALRKSYDELAEKITSNRLLRPREDQHANLGKLNAEIAELERESREYAQTWAERRAQFGKIIEEGMHLRRSIRDEKEEVERREGMEEREDGDEGDASGRISGVATPRHETGDDTPMHNSPRLDALAPPDDRSNRGKSPLNVSEAAQGSQETTKVEDTDMAEDGEDGEDGEVSEGVGEASGEGTIGERPEAADRTELHVNGAGDGDQMDTT
ncbi:MAG: hypothetical protein MMC33_009649 [Icmadophila ericetorum]|nr:hypothetical protein [Icmadophila ericetorum]